MSTLYQAITKFMDDADRHHVDEADALIVTDINGDHGTWRVFTQITEAEDERYIVIHAHLPARIPEDHRLKVAELLTRINYDLIQGNFELNFDDGSVLFKTTLDLADGVLTQAMFERIYEINGQTMNQYYALIMSVGYGGKLVKAVTAEERPDGVVLQ
ncbi:MAG: YbjN domain-containing protein [Dechloromonas sp.]|nr:YbjN domain-containing protein [Dechloromonas sp.]